MPLSLGIHWSSDTKANFNARDPTTKNNIKREIRLNTLYTLSNYLTKSKVYIAATQKSIVLRKKQDEAKIE